MIVALVIGRKGSKGFPEKNTSLVLGNQLAWYPMITAKKVTKLIVSSSKNKNDDNLINNLKKNEIKFFRGDLENVAMRLYETAKKNKAKFFVRISGDSPLIDSKTFRLTTYMVPTL